MSIPMAARASERYRCAIPSKPESGGMDECPSLRDVRMRPTASVSLDEGGMWASI